MRTPTPLATAAHATIIALLVSACQPVLMEKGNILEPEKVSAVQSGVSTKAQVLALLGSPTLVNSFRPNRWVYIQERVFDGNRVINRLEIDFDAQGKVVSVERNFDDALLDPKTASTREEVPSSWARLWKAMTEKKTVAAKKDSEAGSSPLDGIINPPSWWQRVFNREEASSTEHQPDTAFRPEESGWWQSIWDEDPTRSKPRETGPLQDPAAIPEPTTPQGDGKQIWQVN